MWHGPCQIPRLLSPDSWIFQFVCLQCKTYPSSPSVSVSPVWHSFIDWFICFIIFHVAGVICRSFIIREIGVYSLTLTHPCLFRFLRRESVLRGRYTAVGPTLKGLLKEWHKNQVLNTNRGDTPFHTPPPPAAQPLHLSGRRSALWQFSFI